MTFDEAVWRQHFIRFEGRIDHFYLDGEGIVTIGIGCQVFEASSLPMVRKADSMRASVVEIMEEFRAVKAMEANHAPVYYEKVCRLRLPDGEINRMFQGRLVAFIKGVQGSITSLERFPEPAALVLVDMAFNLGVEGLKRKFPRFMNAYMAKDWPTCALECRRIGIQKERNEWTRQTFENLASSTAATS